jgi:adenylate kinase
MRLILLGAPGAGKGTQAEILSERFSIPIISTGNILKEAVARETELGLAARDYIDKGLLVPDDIIIGVVKERLEAGDCADGFILDGVPRTAAQARALDDMGVTVDRVISLEVPDEVIVERISGRRICDECGSSYHVSDRKPAEEGVCDRCGGLQVIRSDDRAETVMTRLRVYHESTERLKDYYGAEGKLRTVTGQEKVSDTTRETLKALEV